MEIKGTSTMAVIKLDAAKRRAKAQQLVAYLSYAVEDVRQLSPTSTHLLEMTIVAINDDVKLPHEPLPHIDRGTG